MSNQPIPNKSLGQHWLNDQAALDSIVKTAQLEPTDTVLEIGPGLGSLTKLLVQVVNQVIAVELDESLANKLKDRVNAPNLEVSQADILSFDLNQLPDTYKVVANIPYYLTGNLIRYLSEASNPPASCTLLIQKEVAQRLMAQPGDLSLIGLTTQFYWQVKTGRVVPASLFEPPPKVDSQIVHLTRRQEPFFTDIDSQTFFNLLKTGFNQKRKTLLNSLSSGSWSKETVETALAQSGISNKQRPQTLSLDDWHKLYINLTR